MVVKEHRQATFTAVHRISVASEQEYHGDVLLFRFEKEPKLQPQANPGKGDISESPTEPDTDPELEVRHLGMIWTGRYILEFQPPPSKAEMGWTAGKGPVENGSSANVLLSTRAFAKRHGLELLSFHARFNFDRQNRALFIASMIRSSLAELTVNGEAVGRQMHVLNQHRMKIRVSSFEYVFEYLPFAATEAFKEERQTYLTRAFGAPSSVVFDMPTSRRDTTLTKRLPM